jgi:hypothetical protein
LIYTKRIVDGYTNTESTLQVIKDIDKVVFESFEKEKLFSEINVPWAQEGKVVNLENYTIFPSGISSTM